jgi:hypothetical protein
MQGYDEQLACGMCKLRIVCCYLSDSRRRWNWQKTEHEYSTVSYSFHVNLQVKLNWTWFEKTKLTCKKPDAPKCVTLSQNALKFTYQRLQIKNLPGSYIPDPL